jgi:hypothetical protein
VPILLKLVARGAERAVVDPTARRFPAHVVGVLVAIHSRSHPTHAAMGLPPYERRVRPAILAFPHLAISKRKMDSAGALID